MIDESQVLVSPFEGITQLLLPIRQHFVKHYAKYIAAAIGAVLGSGFFYGYTVHPLAGFSVAVLGISLIVDLIAVWVLVQDMLGQ